MSDFKFGKTGNVENIVESGKLKANFIQSAIDGERIFKDELGQALEAVVKLRELYDTGDYEDLVYACADISERFNVLFGMAGTLHVLKWVATKE